MYIIIPILIFYLFTYSFFNKKKRAKKWGLLNKSGKKINKYKVLIVTQITLICLLLFLWIFPILIKAGPT